MNLPEDIQNIIYQYKHQIEHVKCMDELTQHKIHCKYNIP